MLSGVVPGEVLVPHSMLWTESKALIRCKPCGRGLVGRGTPEALSLSDIRDSKASCLTPPPLPDTEHTFTACPVFISIRVCYPHRERKLRDHPPEEAGSPDRVLTPQGAKNPVY